MISLAIHPFQSHADYLAMGFESDDFDVQESCFLARRKFIQEFGFALITRESVDVLIQELKTVDPKGKTIDAGSGSGYVAYELKRCGVEVLAIDSRDYRIQTGRGYEIRHVYQLDMVADAASVVQEVPDISVVLLVWPPHDWPFAYEVAAAMRPGQVLFFCGEAQGGATANDAFFAEVESVHWQRLPEIERRINKFHIRFPNMHDCWCVYKRVKGTP